MLHVSYTYIACMLHLCCMYVTFMLHMLHKRADEGNSVFESFSLISILVFPKVFVSYLIYYKSKNKKNIENIPVRVIV